MHKKAPDDRGFFVFWYDYRVEHLPLFQRAAAAFFARSFRCSAVRDSRAFKRFRFPAAFFAGERERPPFLPRAAAALLIVSITF